MILYLLVKIKFLYKMPKIKTLQSKKPPAGW